MRAASGDSAPRDHPDWAQLLIEAVSKPGIISEAYNRFWNYSVGNQILALFQCHERGLALGTIHTFMGWKSVGRSVRKGEKAITLCMPVSVKRKLKDKGLEIRSGDGAERQLDAAAVQKDGEPTATVTLFVYKPHWFVLSQTEGADYVPAELPVWREPAALYALGIERVAFTHPNGNCQGYAWQRQVAVSPVAVLPHKTLMHELAHVVLGHTEEGSKLDDHDLTPRSLREVEAECVALICCESLGMSGTAESRGYVQHWLGSGSIPDRSVQKIFKAADAILKAGRPADPAV